VSLALAAYDNRISSLLETANRFVVLDMPINITSSKKIVAISDFTLPYLMQLLHNNHIAILICGAINGCLYRAICAMEIQVIPWITGNVDDIINAFKNNSLQQWMMPGCQNSFCRGKKERHGWKKFNSEVG